MGGHLALHVAVACPGRVAGLLLIDPLGAVGDGGAADVGRALGQRLLPAAISRYQEVAARLSGPAAGHLPGHEQPGCVADALSRLGDLTGEPESVG